MRTMVAHEPRKQARYWPMLDLIRVGAALAVTLYHLCPQGALFGAAPIGWVGVEVFLVLSGVLIGSADGAMSVGDFVRARILRLYPAAWVCLAISLAAMALAKQAGVGAALPPLAVVSSAALLKVWPGGFIASAYWTLPVEIAFYSLFALSLSGSAAVDRRRLGFALILWSAVYFGGLAFLATGHRPMGSLDIEYGTSAMTLARHGLYFGIGLLIADAGRGRVRLAHVTGCGLAVGLGAVEIIWRAWTLAGAALFMATAVGAFGTWCLAVALIARSVVWGRPAMPSPENRSLRLAGAATYPLYLLHQTLGGAVIVLLHRIGVDPLTASVSAIASSMMAAIAVAAWWEPWTRHALDRLMTSARIKTSAVFARS